MKSFQVFHTSQLMRALDAQPHELRAWLRMEPLASREKKRRSATEFTALDVLFLVVIKKLDSAGIAPKVLQTFSESIYKVLQRPIAASGNSDELLLYKKDDDGVWKTGTPPVDSAAIELRIPLRNARAQLLRYTGAHLISGTTEMSLLASIQDTGSLAGKAVRSGRRKSQ